MLDPTHSTEERGSTDSICTAVVCAVAEAKGVDPLDLEPRLHDVVDPDALERLFRSTRPSGSAPYGRVTFALSGCEVVVRSNGRVTATPQDLDGPCEPVGGPVEQTSREQASVPSVDGTGLGD